MGLRLSDGAGGSVATDFVTYNYVRYTSLALGSADHVPRKKVSVAQ